MIGTRRGNVCSWLDVFGAADAMMARVLLAHRGQELSGGVMCKSNDQAVILVGRVPRSRSLSKAGGEGYVVQGWRQGLTGKQRHTDGYCMGRMGVLRVPGQTQGAERSSFPVTTSSRRLLSSCPGI